MNIGSAIYTVFIGPLKLLFEVVYTFAYFLTGNAGLSIVALSLAMNILLLPLYKQADDIQAKENDIQNKLKKGTDHIKKAFKGDEQYMVLNTYYRQNNYKPIYALRSSISLLLQIPFFIAAYDFLSNEYTVLSSGFGPIGSLGSPDNLLGGLNLLPILMTVINIVSSIIYTKGQPLKNNIQLYIMALAFLIFLYNRPSGLVMYWTLNNLFSLIKNIFAKLKNAQLVLSVLMAVVGVAGLIFVLFIHPLSSLLMNVVAIVTMLMFILPLLYYVFLRDKGIFNSKNYSDNQLVKNDFMIIAAIFLCIFYGLFIPSQVVHSSPSEFVDIVNVVSPVTYIMNSLALSFGTFLVWFVIYYSLMKNRIKSIFGFVLIIICFLAVTNYLFFGRNLGLISNMLVYDEGMQYTNNEIFVNAAVVILLIILITILYIYKKSLLKSLLIILIIFSSIISTTYIVSIKKDTDAAIAEINKARANKAKIHLSKDGKNVVVIILDRASDEFFPYILNEKPELKEKYAGFTYYPNTLSYSYSTNMAIPCVYGGYEYIPEEMDKRDSEYLVEKHNEALRVMPVLFHDNGFDVTVFDPAYANYKSPGDLSIYEEYPYIKKYITEYGMFEYDPSLVRNNMDLLNRNLFCFGITKSAPLILQPTLYAGGSYNSIDRYQAIFNKDSLSELSYQAYVKDSFLESYSVLQNMIDITEISDDDSDNFLMMYNQSTHEPVLLQTPDYDLQRNIDNYEFDLATNYSRSDDQGNTLLFDNLKKMSHYHVNMASLKELSLWLDYLRENDVYDNTRIIIVADHGIADLRQDEKMVLEGIDLLAFNPLFLCKDFDSTELSSDKTFMTNADTFFLATKDILNHPVNPFTGIEMNDEQKHQTQKVVIATSFNVNDNNGKTFLPGIDLEFKGEDIFNLQNWKLKY